MIYVGPAESGDGAIVDISFEDCQLLSAVATEVLDIVENAEFMARTGYQPHAYDYLFVWMGENQPDATRRLSDRREILASLKSEVGSPTTSELLLATKIGDSDTPTVRWKLNRDALLMFNSALREILDYFTPSIGFLQELSTRTGFQAEDFRAVHAHIKRLLFASNDHYAPSTSHSNVGKRYHRGQISGINSPQDLEAAVRDAITNFSDIAGVESAKGAERAVFYKSENPILVIMDKANNDNGTTFRPQYLRNYFLKLSFNEGSFGSGGFSGEHQRLFRPSGRSTESGLQITGVVGGGGAGDPSSNAGAFAGGDSGDGAAFFLHDSPPTRAVHASPGLSKPSITEAKSPSGELPHFETKPPLIRRAEFKTPRMRTWPDVDWAQHADPDPNSSIGSHEQSAHDSPPTPSSEHGYRRGSEDQTHG